MFYLCVAFLLTSLRTYLLQKHGFTKPFYQSSVAQALMNVIEVLTFSELKTKKNKASRTNILQAVTTFTKVDIFYTTYSVGIYFNFLIIIPPQQTNTYTINHDKNKRTHNKYAL